VGRILEYIEIIESIEPMEIEPLELVGLLNDRVNTHVQVLGTPIHCDS